MTDTITESVQQLTERITDWRSPTIEVDATSRWVKNIALAGRESRNGYQYSQEALTDAVQLYEHKPVFLDHAERLTKPFERSTRDLVGSIVNARFEGDRIRGDIRVLDTEAGRTFLALAEAEQTPVGMSHVVLARRSNDRTQVESIEVTCPPEPTPVGMLQCPTGVPEQEAGHAQKTFQSRTDYSASP